MDRVTVYDGELPQAAHVLKLQQNAMVALAKNAETILGTSTLVSGFTCTQTTPASLNVLLTAGTIYQQENLEASTWSVLGTDTHTISKQGIQLDPVTFGITPPGTVGLSQVFLIEVQYAESDTDSALLLYYNSANPLIPLNGAGGSGTSQNTSRKGIVASQVKAGIAATTGTQVAPSADAGWTGLFTVTVANGAATITAGNIATLSTAPFLAANGTLPGIPTGVLNCTWTSNTDTGAVNALVVTLAPVPTSYTAFMSFRVKVGHTTTAAATINVNGLGTKSILRPDGSATLAGDMEVNDIVSLTYDGTAFRMIALPRQAITRIAATQKQRVFIDDTPGTRNFTVPADVFSLDVECWGSSSGTFASTTTFSSGGGGAATYARKAVTVTPGQVISYTVATAGTQGATGFFPTDGATTSFGGVVSAAGSTINGSATLLDPRNGGNSGNAGAGDVVIQGQPGVSAINVALGSPGGSSFGFGGANTFPSGAGGSGFGPGAGGTGAGNNGNATAFAGANGMNGRVSVRY